MSFAGLDGPLVYAGILAAAAVEGEVAYVMAAVLVGQGRLDAIGVALAGTLGASIGDQFFYYLLRGRLRRWLDRYEWIARRSDALVNRAVRHQIAMVFLIRFAPALRIALAAACAYAGVPPLRFSLVSVISSAAWAIVVLAIVAWAGPAWLPAVGISGWWSGLVPAFLLILLFHGLGRAERRALGPEEEVRS